MSRALTPSGRFRGDSFSPSFSPPSFGPAPLASVLDAVMPAHAQLVTAADAGQGGATSAGGALHTPTPRIRAIPSSLPGVADVPRDLEGQKRFYALRDRILGLGARAVGTADDMEEDLKRTERSLEQRADEQSLGEDGHGDDLCDECVPSPSESEVREGSLLTSMTRLISRVQLDDTRCRAGAKTAISLEFTSIIDEPQLRTRSRAVPAHEPARKARDDSRRRTFRL